MGCTGRILNLNFTEEFPDLHLEEFYQQGVNCRIWCMPRPYVEKALRAVSYRAAHKFGPQKFKHLRAFVQGLRGVNSSVDCSHTKLCPSDYAWPLPPNHAWSVVVCVYPDGYCEIDFIHPVSRKFWSEYNSDLSLPETKHILTAKWFRDMGVEVLRMQPEMTAIVSEYKKTHLTLV